MMSSKSSKSFIPRNMSENGDDFEQKTKMRKFDLEGNSNSTSFATEQ